MKRFLIALCLLLPLPAHAQQSKAALVSEVNVNWPDNTTGAITPALLRNTVIDIINSYTDLHGHLAFLTFSTGYITTVVSASGPASYSLISTQSVVDNVVAGAGSSYTCTSTPTVNLLECGASNVCAVPVTIASVPISGANIAYTASVLTPTIGAGHFIAWKLTGGACTNVNVRGTAQIHQ